MAGTVGLTLWSPPPGRSTATRKSQPIRYGITVSAKHRIVLPVYQLLADPTGWNHWIRANG